MTNPPLTYIINIINICSYISGNTRMTIPMNFGTILPGFIMANVFPIMMSKKYLHGDITKLKILDFLTHWLPAIISIKLNSNRKINFNHILSVYILPWMYFSMRFKKNGTFWFTNPIKHVQKTYPGVPMWVFTTWYIGSTLPYFFDKKYCMYTKLKTICHSNQTK